MAKSPEDKSFALCVERALLLCFAAAGLSIDEAQTAQRCCATTAVVGLASKASWWAMVRSRVGLLELGTHETCCLTRAAGFGLGQSKRPCQLPDAQLGRSGIKAPTGNPARSGSVQDHTWRTSSCPCSCVGADPLTWNACVTVPCGTPVSDSVQRGPQATGLPNSVASDRA